MDLIFYSRNPSSTNPTKWSDTLTDHSVVLALKYIRNGSSLLSSTSASKLRSAFHAFVFWSKIKNYRQNTIKFGAKLIKNVKEKRKIKFFIANDLESYSFKEEF